MKERRRIVRGSVSLAARRTVAGAGVELGGVVGDLAGAAVEVVAPAGSAGAEGPAPGGGCRPRWIGAAPLLLLAAAAREAVVDEEDRAGGADSPRDRQQDAAQGGAGRRDQQQEAEEVGDEARRQQQGAAEDDRRAVVDLLGRDAGGSEHLLEAAPGEAALRAQQHGAEEAVEQQQRDRRPDTDRAAHLDDQVELRDREHDEEQHQNDEHAAQRR